MLDIDKCTKDSKEIINDLNSIMMKSKLPTYLRLTALIYLLEGWIVSMLDADIPEEDKQFVTELLRQTNNNTKHVIIII